MDATQLFDGLIVAHSFYPRGREGVKSDALAVLFAENLRFRAPIWPHLLGQTPNEGEASAPERMYQSLLGSLGVDRVWCCVQQ